MAKERDRRYASASEFDDDLERYLNGDAVRAGPAGKWYRARRFMSRNRLPLAVAGSVAAAIVVVAILLAVGLIVLNKNYQQLQVAETKEREANTQLTTSLEETLQAKEVADRANKSLEKQLLLQRVSRASTQSHANWELARNELEQVSDSERSWLWRLLEARMPRDVTDSHQEFVERYAQIRDQADSRYYESKETHEILELSPKTKQAIVAFGASNEPLTVELISMETNPSEPVVLAKYNSVHTQRGPSKTFTVGRCMKIMRKTPGGWFGNMSAQKVFGLDSAAMVPG